MTSTEIATGAAHTALEQEIKGKVCVTCESEPRIVYKAPDFALRCNCTDEPGAPKALMLRKHGGNKMRIA